jgi:hypothetical protein
MELKILWTKLFRNKLFMEKLRIFVNKLLWGKTGKKCKQTNKLCRGKN